MKLATSIALAALLAGAALMFCNTASAAPVLKRIAITADEVAKNNGGPWQELASKAGLPWKELFADSDGEACGTEDVLPAGTIGRMYGGSWGSTGSRLMEIFPGGWKIYGKAVDDNGDYPGVLGDAPDGVIVHAQMGKTQNGKKIPFLCVGSAPGAHAGSSALAITKQFEDLLANAEATEGDWAKAWESFDDAVAGTSTGKAADFSKDALIQMGVGEDAEGNPVVPDNLKSAETKKAEATKAKADADAKAKAEADAKAKTDENAQAEALLRQYQRQKGFHPGLPMFGWWGLLLGVLLIGISFIGTIPDKARTALLWAGIVSS